MPWYQAIVLSTTHLNTPRPEPRGWPRRAMRVRMPLAWTALRWPVSRILDSSSGWLLRRDAALVVGKRFGWDAVAEG